MSFEQRDNSGSMFANDRKTSDNHPDRSGTAMIDGVEYFVDGWLKRTKDGKPWLSLSFKRKGKQGSSPRQSQPARRQSSGFDDGEGPPF